MTETEAYAVFDSSDGSLTIFRDEVGKYSNNQIIGTKRYYAGIEDIEGDNDPKWSSERSSFTVVNITDKFAPKTAFYMFHRCSNLASINGIENMDTSNMTDMTSMKNMFFGCSNLTTLNLSNFKTSNVRNMSYMFTNCSKLMTLDLSSFDTSNVTNMTNMFYGCSSLMTIYVDDNKWNTSAVTSSGNMFKGCSNLVGEKGTVYDLNYINKTRAIVDDAPDNPGYLTRKVSKKYSVYVKQNNTWYQGTVKTKKNNTWQNIIKLYTKVNGTWM